MYIITVANQKGGVGKTSAAVHLGAAFARHSLNVVIIDLDPQANATAILSDPKVLAEEAPSTAEVLVDEVPIGRILRATTEPGVLLAPASKRLAAAQMMLTSKLDRERALSRALAGYDEANIILIDTGPEGQLALANALVASTHVLIPFTPDAAALHGMRSVEALVDVVRQKGLNPKLRRAGLLQIGMDKRLNVTEGVRDFLEEERGELLMNSAIRANARFLGTVGQHRTIFDLEKGTDRKGSIDYTEAAAELWNRLSPQRVAA
jgi:chromosome partitioning protein